MQPFAPPTYVHRLPSLLETALSVLLTAVPSSQHKSSLTVQPTQHNPVLVLATHCGRTCQQPNTNAAWPHAVLPHAITYSLQPTAVLHARCADAIPHSAHAYPHRLQQLAQAAHLFVLQLVREPKAVRHCTQAGTEQQHQAALMHACRAPVHCTALHSWHHHCLQPPQQPTALPSQLAS